MAKSDPASRRVRLSRKNRDQLIRIPEEFKLPGREAIIRRDGDRLIIEPVRTSSLLELLASWEPLDEAFPDIDADLLPLRDVDIQI